MVEYSPIDGQLRFPSFEYKQSPDIVDRFALIIQRVQLIKKLRFTKSNLK
tara:strand:+ start:2653 stop:2802 length:150 start_codon:yes stop_codon:yes gene_type:complete